MFQRADMLLIAETVAREKNIDKERVFEAMESAVEKAGRSKYGSEHDIRAAIDRDTGAIFLHRYRLVVDEPSAVGEVSLVEARRHEASVEVGGHVKEELPPPDDFGRIATQIAKHVIVQLVREAEREQQYEKFKDRVGTAESGTVKRIEYGNLIIDLGEAEGVIRREHLIPREHLKRGDRTLSYIYEVKRDNRGPQIFLSRTHPQLMVLLFRQEVPEVYDGVVEIMGCARDPGSRAKVGVLSKDSSIDPVGACVGMRGSRVQAVVSELQGEKVDIVPHSEDIATYVVNALAPAEVTKVVLDEEKRKIEVIVEEDQLSQAIGRRGQNVRLASQLTSYDIDLLSESQDSERREQEFLKRRDMFVSALDVDDVIARLLITEGFASIDEVAEVIVEELTAIEGFDETLANELQSRAQSFVEKRTKEQKKLLKELQVEKKLIEFTHLNLTRVVKLAEAGIRTLDDFAGQTPEDLLDAEEGALKDEELQSDAVGNMILQARLALGWISEEDLAPKQEEQTQEEQAQAEQTQAEQTQQEQTQQEQTQQEDALSVAASAASDEGHDTSLAPEPRQS